jgi:hypothetical protein
MLKKKALSCHYNPKEGKFVRLQTVPHPKRTNIHTSLTLRCMPGRFHTSLYCTSLQITPKGLRDVIVWIKEEYGEEWEIMITENGFADEGELNDTIRIGYLAVSIQYLVELTIIFRSPYVEITPLELNVN